MPKMKAKILDLDGFVIKYHPSLPDPEQHLGAGNSRIVNWKLRTKVILEDDNVILMLFPRDREGWIKVYSKTPRKLVGSASATGIWYIERENPAHISAQKYR